MAPEQIEGRPLDGRADQFAFGAVLYEMFAGQSPFRRSTVHETLTAVVKEEPRPLVEVRGDLPPALRRLVARCVSKDPQERYASTHDLALALEDVRADLVPVARGDTRGRRWRGGAAAMLAAAAIAALATMAAVAWWRSSGGRSPGAATPTAHPTLAVLPFGTIGSGEQYFADGITEAVTTELGKLRGVRVIASNAAFAYRDKGASLDEVRQKLQAGLVVSGSVQRAGDAVRISARLIDTTEQTTLWTESYRRELRDILALQDEIARQIAATIARRFHAVPGAATSASAVPVPAPTTVPEAYDAYLRGLASLRGRAVHDAEGRLAAAAEELERAVALDPNFALARAVLASAYTQRFFYEAADAEFERKAFLEISKALAVNPDQAEAYLARAQLIWNVRNGFPHERAVADLRRALAINPNLAEAHLELGKIYYHIGLTDKAVAANEEVLRLDPSSWDAERRRLRALVDAGRAADFADELPAATPRGGDTSHVEALWMLGRPREAMQALGDPPASKANPPRGTADDAALRALFHAALGNDEDAERWISVAKKYGTNPLGVSDLHHVDFHVGAALSLMGRRDEAVQWLKKAADEGYPSYPRFVNDPSLAGLKDQPAFRALLERLRQAHARRKETL